VITNNVIGSVVHGPLALVQRLNEELSVEKLRGATSTVMASAVSKLDEAASILEAFRVKEAAIQTDANLSDQGKRTKMETTAKEFHAKLAFVEQAANDRREAARQLRAELDTLPKVTTDPVLAYLREQEIRQELRKLAQPERMKLVSQSVERKDLSILQAVRNDPFNAHELIPHEFMSRMLDQSLEKNRAEDLERWRTLTLCAEKLQLLANTLDVVLGRYRLDLPTFPTPPIGKVDLGQKNQQQAPEKKSSVDVPPKTVGAFQ